MAVVVSGVAVLAVGGLVVCARGWAEAARVQAVQTLTPGETLVVPAGSGPSPLAPPAIAVAGGKVYLAAGGRLYRFDAGTLRLEKQGSYGPQPPTSVTIRRQSSAVRGQAYQLPGGPGGGPKIAPQAGTLWYISPEDAPAQSHASPTTNTK
jgi:hypothetical protein